MGPANDRRQAPARRTSDARPAGHAMSGNASLLLFQWRDAFCSQAGPPATTRLVLWTLSKYMGLDGTDAFPNQETIAHASGLGLRTVKEHLEYAEEAGWISRNPRRKGAKRSSRFGTEYLPRFPCAELQGAPGAPSPIEPPGRKRRLTQKMGAPDAGNGAPGTRKVHRAAAISTKNSSADLDAYKNSVLYYASENEKVVGRRSALAESV